MSLHALLSTVARKRAGLGGDVTAPTLTSAAIDGDQLTLVFDEAVSQGAGFAVADITIDATITGSAIEVVTVDSGNGTDTWVCTVDTPVVEDDVVTLDWAGTANGIEDAAGNDLAAIVADAVTNDTVDPPAFLLEEDCEGTGTPAGWTDNGTVNWDSTATVLAGSQSFQITSNASSGGWWSTGVFTEIAGTAHAFLALRTASLSGNPRLVSLRASTGAAVIVAFGSTGTLEIIDPDNGVRAQSAGGTVATNTTYYLWIDYTPGTGANAVVDLYLSTTTTKPGSPTLSTTSGEGTVLVDRIRLSTANFTTAIHDYIRVSTSPIGSAP